MTRRRGAAAAPRPRLHRYHRQELAVVQRPVAVGVHDLQQLRHLSGGGSLRLALLDEACQLRLQRDLHPPESRFERPIRSERRAGDCRRRRNPPFVLRLGR